MTRYFTVCLFASLLSASPLFAASTDKAPAEAVASDFIGTWHTTSATNSFILNIQPGGDALFVLIQKGAHGMNHVTWRPMPGGILIEGLCRLRFWKGRHQNEARVEMEPLPPELVEASLRKFPTRFFMRRLRTKQRFAKPLSERPLPDGWKEAKLPAEWDKTAGKRAVAR